MDSPDRQNQPHRPGLFKTAPKKHTTGRHRSKRAIARQQKGKLSVKSLGVQKRLEFGKMERRQRLSQIRANKSAKLMEQRRQEGDAPYLVTIISLDSSRPVEQLIQMFSEADSDSSGFKGEQSPVYHLNVPRFRARFSFLCPTVASPSASVQPVLDAVRTSDLLLLFWPLGVECLLASQERLLAALLAQGLPATLNAVGGMPKSGKQRETARKQLEKAMKNWHAEHRGRVHDLDTAGDALQILRQMSAGKKSLTNLQRQRPYLVVEHVQADEDGTNTSNCTLKVDGYLRGTPLNVNGLVHLPGWGDFQLARIDRRPDPHPLRLANKHGLVNDNTATLLAQADPAKQTALDSEIVPDPMEAEQTWPDEDEIGDDKFAVPKVKKRVPKGTSDYQANWLIDDEDEEETRSREEMDGSDEDETEDEEDEDGIESIKDGKCDDVRSVVTAEEESEMDAGEEGEYAVDDNDTDEMARERFRLQRENLQWPDEVETPRDVSARQRFQRYRGLKSFRTSPWDPKEDLPRNYARIYRFVNFKRTRKLALAEPHKAFEAEVEPGEFAYPGTFVTLHIVNVPRQILEFLSPSLPLLIIYGLLRHEHRMSVLNFVLQKHPSSPNTIIKSKDKLIFQVGCRRFAASPLFSQHTNGKKFKLERFMPLQGAFCATVFAPITYPPTNVTVFRLQNSTALHSQSLELVAFGIVLNTSPDRIVLKRVVLSGHPYKVNKRTAVVRYMFYNREDIEWFKPLELYTHGGRRGRIKQPLGIQGLVKCVFDQPLSVQDSVLMNLYKRVFPNWDYDDRLAQLNATNSEGKNCCDGVNEKLGKSNVKTVHFSSNADEEMIVE